MSKYYTPSGSFSPLSIVYFLVACFIVIPILSTIYAYAIWYIPFPYINFFITAGFGFFVGAIISFLAVKLGKVRNNKIAFAFGFIGCLFALYFHWAVWIDLVFNISNIAGDDDMGVAVSNAKFGQVLNLVTNPGGLFSVIGEIGEIGTWGIGSGAVKGTMLKAIWVIETLMILVIGSFMPMGNSQKPFCEENQKWFNETELTPFGFITNPEETIKGLEDGQDSVFETLEKSQHPDTDSHSIFTLFANETNENYLSITNKEAKLKDDEIKFEERSVVNYIKISEALSKKLEHLS